MNKKSSGIFTIVIFLIAIIALGYYTHLTNQAPGHQDVSPSSEKEILIGYDMINDYPKTVREVVKLHSRYMKYMYTSGASGEYSEDELFTMNQKSRQLLDQELLEANSEEKQLGELRKQIELYAEQKMKIISYTLAEASQIEYNTDSGVEFAKMRVTLAMTVDGSSFSAEQEYILRQDEEGKWKILGWQTVTRDANPKEGEK